MIKVFGRTLMFGLLVSVLGMAVHAASPIRHAALPKGISTWSERRNIADVMKNKVVPDSTSSMKPASAAMVKPRIGKASHGFIKYLGAPQASVFATKANAKTAGADAIAQSFMRENKQFFVSDSAYVSFKTNRVRKEDDRTFVRMSQTYKGIPVWSASVMVQVKEGQGVAMASSDIMRDLMPLEAGFLSTEPTISSEWAEYLAKQDLAKKGNLDLNIQYEMDDLVASQPELMIYEPSVVGNEGPARLVWNMIVTRNDMMFPKETYIIDAHSGEVAFRYNMVCSHLYRSVHYVDDAVEAPKSVQHYVWNVAVAQGTIRRWEEDQDWAGIARVNGLPPGYDWPVDWAKSVYAPAASAPANFAFAYLGEWYNFMKSQHNRIGVYPEPWAISHEVLHPDRPDYGLQPGTELYMGAGLPIENAFYAGLNQYDGSTLIFFGLGYSSADDVIAHELQHGVTSFGCGLNYFNQSGAIDESFSDMWGEWIDLVNVDYGTNGPGYEWLLGEDIHVPNQGGTGSPGGFGWTFDGEARTAAIRDLRNPPYYGDPDKMSSPYWYNDLYDSGGVHMNNGVGNKLCYLLTQGDVFNNRSVFGFGITKSTEGIANPWPALGTVSAPELFYEVMHNLLNPGSDYEDMYYALIQAGYNLNVTFEELVNIDKACAAVEIKPPSITETYTIKYKDKRNKHLQPFIDELTGSIIISDPEAFGTLKIKRKKEVKRGRGMPTLPTIQMIRSAGSITKIYTEAEIEKLEVAGRIDSLVAKKSHVKLIETGEALGSVKMTHYARSWSMGDYTQDIAWPTQEFTEGEVFMTAIHSKSSWTPQFIDPASKPLKIKLIGVSLMEVFAPAQIADIQLSTKKWNRKMYGADFYGEKEIVMNHRDTSYSGIPPQTGQYTLVVDGESPALVSIRVGKLNRLKYTGSGLYPYEIRSLASTRGKSKIKGVAQVFSTSYDQFKLPIYYWGDIMISDAIEMRTRSMSIDMAGGYLSGASIFCDGEIKEISTKNKLLRSYYDDGSTPTLRTLDLGGQIGYFSRIDFPYDSLMVVASGRDPSLDLADIGRVYSVGLIKAAFMAGVDLTPDPQNFYTTENIRGSVELFEIDRNTRTNPLDGIVGRVWSKDPPKYLGHHNQMMEHELGSILPPDIGDKF